MTLKKPRYRLKVVKLYFDYSKGIYKGLLIPIKFKNERFVYYALTKLS